MMAAGGSGVIVVAVVLLIVTLLFRRAPIAAVVVTIVVVLEIAAAAVGAEFAPECLTGFKSRIQRSRLEANQFENKARVHLPVVPMALYGGEVCHCLAKRIGRGKPLLIR
jgi:hypothetical protein